MCVNGSYLFGILKVNTCTSKNTVVSVSDNLVQNITRTLINNTNNLTTQTTANQIMRVIAGEMSCTNLSFAQDIQSATSISVELSSEDVTEFKETVNNEIEKTIKSSMENKQGFLSDLPQAQDLSVEVRDIMRKITEDVFQRDTIQNVLSSTSTYQEMELAFGKLTGENCDFHQNIALELGVQQVMNLVINRAFDSEYTNRIIELITAEVQSTTNGPIEAFGEKKGQKKGPLVLGAIALAVIGLIGGIIFLVIQSGRGRTQSVSNEQPVSSPVVESSTSLTDTTDTLDEILDTVKLT